MYRLDIIYEDKNILVVNKQAGLLTISTKNEKEKTLYHYAYEYLHKKNQKVYIVHRLDKDTSGIVLFAKKLEIKIILQENWETTQRYYYAIVIGQAKKEDIIKSYLNENKNLITYVTNKSNGKLAITKYTRIRSSDKYSLLDIEIKTGRKNQIRVQLNSVNLPILGDYKYGSNRYKSMCLHAYKLIINYPKTNKKMIFESKKPNYFIL